MIHHDSKQKKGASSNAFFAFELTSFLGKESEKSKKQRKKPRKEAKKSMRKKRIEKNLKKERYAILEGNLLRSIQIEQV